jgi:hypothetical protein
MTIEDASGMKASDSAARGLNHRVGRTSRAGRLREGIFSAGDEL